MIQGLRRVLTLFNRRDRLWLGVIFLAMVLASLLEVVSLGAVPVLITAVAEPQRVANWPLLGPALQDLGVEGRRQVLLWGAVAFVGVFLLRTAVIVLARYMQLHFAATRQVRIAKNLFERYLHAPYEFHLQRNSSELIRNLQTGGMRIGNQIILQLLGALQGGLMLLAIVGLLLVAEPGVTLLTVLVAGLVGGLFIRLTRRRTRKLGALETAERKEVLKVLRHAFEGIKETLVSGKQAYFIRDFQVRARRVTETQEIKQFIAFLSGPLLEVVGVVALMSMAVVLLATGRDLAEVTALLGLFTISILRMRTYLAGLLGAYTNLVFNLESVTPLFTDLEVLERPPVGASNSMPLQLEKEIRFNGISYRYPGSDTNILNNLSLVIPRGAYVGVKGETGVGKSTLVNILLGLLRPEEGDVTVDGQSIFNDLKGWRKIVAYVPQDVFLLDDTVLRNVAYGQVEERMDRPRAEHALERAQLLDFVEKLPEGLDTLIGERGVRFSGGQRQRLSIARALYSEPELLVFDEATSALDPVTERELVQAIDSLKGRLTILSVAHREASLARCDQVIVLGQGEVENAATIFNTGLTA